MNHRILLLAALFCTLHRALAAAEVTSVEVFVDRDERSHREPNLTVPAGTNTLHFLVEPRALFARYKLVGLDEDWNQRTDNIFFRVVFLNPHGDPIRMDSFPVSGRSAGWNGSVKDSVFTPRTERVTVPPDAVAKVLISDSRFPEGPKAIWNKSGTHPSMAVRSKVADSEDSSPVLVIVDDDINAHADWISQSGDQQQRQTYLWCRGLGMP